eukprot:2334849-Prymnesium_polylepis.1
MFGHAIKGEDGICQQLVAPFSKARLLLCDRSEHVNRRVEKHLAEMCGAPHPCNSIENRSSFSLLRKPRQIARCWLEQHPEIDGDRLLVFVDGSDVVWGGCHDFSERFEAVAAGTPIVFAAELGCEVHVPLPPGCSGIPHPTGPALAAQSGPAGMLRYALCEHVPGSLAPCSTPPAYKFLNSGSFAGRARDVCRMIRAVLAYHRKRLIHRRRGEPSTGTLGLDDQVGFTSYWLDHPDRVRLDYTNELFLTLFRLNDSSLVLSKYHRRTSRGLKHHPHETSFIAASWRPNWPLCFIHNNGRSAGDVLCRVHMNMRKKDSKFFSSCGGGDAGALAPDENKEIILSPFPRRTAILDTRRTYTLAMVRRAR